MTRSGPDGGIEVTRAAACAAAAEAGSWEQAAQTLAIRPGLAFMVATGVPADGSGVPEFSDRLCGGPELSSPQSLVNPRGHNPLRNSSIEAWIRGRAGRELG